MAGTSLAVSAAVEIEVRTERRDDGGFDVSADPVDVREVTLPALPLPQAVVDAAEARLEEMVRAELVDIDPIPVIAIGARELPMPLRGLRVAPEGRGLRIEILTGAKVTGVDKGKTLKATVEKGGKSEPREVDTIISAVGVVGNIEGLGLEALGVKTDRGTIVTDGLGRTNVAGVYAIGDVAGPPMLAHKAEHEGVICVEAIAGLHPHPLDKAQQPPPAPTPPPRQNRVWEGTKTTLLIIGGLVASYFVFTSCGGSGISGFGFSFL